MSLFLLLRPFGGTPPPPQPPSIISFAPPSGPIGTVVILTGSSFTGVTDVSFNGTPASFVVDNDGQITVTVPVGATDGLISATNPQGTGFSATPFDVTAVVVAGTTPGGVRKRKELRIRFADIHNRQSTAEFLKSQLRKYEQPVTEKAVATEIKVIQKKLQKDLIQVQVLDGEARKQKLASINNALILLMISDDS